jgi:hypothetical protein
MLIRSEARYDRLRFLVETGQQGAACGIKGVMNWSDEKLETRFSDWLDWQAERAAAAAADAAAAAAAEEEEGGSGSDSGG